MFSSTGISIANQLSPGRNGGSEKMIVTLPDGINAVTAMPVDLRGEKIGEPIKIIAGKFGFEVNAYAPASFILQ